MIRIASWVKSANVKSTDFPLENLPFCIFCLKNSLEKFEIGIGIGSKILNLNKLSEFGFLKSLPSSTVDACSASLLNDLFSLGRGAIRDLRKVLQNILADGFVDQSVVEKYLLNQNEVKYALPLKIGDFSDFLSSFNHAYNVGMMLRPDEPVLPNFHTIPIAYHGRSSSILVSDEPIYRPSGVKRVAHGKNEILFGPTKRLDLEVELGAYIGSGNKRGVAISVDDADEQIVGFSVLNDWSARDIQSWETQPLGPFLGKNFASTVAPWVVCTDALEAYKVPTRIRENNLPELHGYLQPSKEAWTYEIYLETYLSTVKMRESGMLPLQISKSLFSRDSVWTFAQMVAHHTVNGCNLQPGDLLGSGTLSGPYKGSEGCMLELTLAGKSPLTLPSGETRSFIEDGDEVTITAFCERPGLPRIGFGRCVSRIEVNP